MIGRVKGVDVGGAPGPVWRLRGYKGVQRRRDAETDRQRACRERLLFLLLLLLLLLGWAGLDCAALGGPGIISIGIRIGIDSHFSARVSVRRSVICTPSFVARAASSRRPSRRKKHCR
jgi:hypothetical protein